MNRIPPDLESVQIIDDVERALVLLKEPRRRILELARAGVSAVDLADRLGETRQRLGYHLRQLVDAGLLDEETGERRGAVVEKRYRARADSYALSPDLLGPLAARLSGGDRESLAHLLGAVHQVQRDVTAVLESGPETRVPTLTLSTRIRFADAAERGAFADALVRALTDVVARCARPFEVTEPDAKDAEPFRLTLTLHPTPS
ncbi:MAG: winged helix-turn-helix domain-containing protein [Gemmatimonadota bacterium]